MIKNFTIITFIVAFFSFSCYGHSYINVVNFINNTKRVSCSSLIVSNAPSTVVTGPHFKIPINEYLIINSSSADNGSIGLAASYVNDVPKIAYTAVSTFKSGLTIAPLTVTSTGGPVDSYTISPSLPFGLKLNTITGVITGTPLGISPTTNYTVTAKNNAGIGISQFTIAITVPDLTTAPVIAYPPLNSFVTNVAIPATDQNKKNSPASVYDRLGMAIPDVEPTVTGGSPISYTIDPTTLPAGLSFNTVTGAITGTPTVATDPKTTMTANTYKITANNGAGSNTVSIVITVVANPDIVISPSIIQFVGAGNIQQSLNTGAAIAANTGIGVIYKQNSSRRYGFLHDIEVDFSINVASTVDTVKSTNSPTNSVTNRQDFGNSVLLPTNSGQAFSFDFKGYFTERGGVSGNYRRNESPVSLGGVLSGFNIAFNGSNRNWQYDAYNDPKSTDPAPSPVLVKASLLSLYVGPFFEYVTPANPDMSITLGFGYSGRWILGDAQQGAEADLRTKLLGTTQSSFTGGELSLGLRFYSIKAEVHLPFLSNKVSVPGLSGAHLTTFIGFTGGFPIALSKPSGQ